MIVWNKVLSFCGFYTIVCVIFNFNCNQNFLCIWQDGKCCFYRIVGLIFNFGCVLLWARHLGQCLFLIEASLNGQCCFYRIVGLIFNFGCVLLCTRQLGQRLFLIKARLTFITMIFFFVGLIVMLWSALCIPFWCPMFYRVYVPRRVRSIVC